MLWRVIITCHRREVRFLRLHWLRTSDRKIEEGQFVREEKWKRYSILGIRIIKHSTFILISATSQAFYLSYSVKLYAI